MYLQKNRRMTRPRDPEARNTLEMTWPDRGGYLLGRSRGVEEVSMAVGGPSIEDLTLRQQRKEEEEEEEEEILEREEQGAVGGAPSQKEPLTRAQKALMKKQEENSRV